MKTWHIIDILIFCVVFAFCSCESNSYEPPSSETTSLITVYGEIAREALPGEEGLAHPDSLVVFTGNDIVWFNPATREIKFRNNFNPSNLGDFQKFHFYLSEKHLFTASKFVIPVHSFAVNDLVIYVEGANRCYLHDCYPLSNAMKSDPVVKQNKESRSDAWNFFINQLNRENKIRK